MGRPRRGERRIDAAIAALSQYGFTKPIIEKAVKELLAVYGNDGWTFIEDGYYSVLLDKLLEEKDATEQAEGNANAEALPEGENMQIAEMHQQDRPSSEADQQAMEDVVPSVIGALEGVELPVLGDVEDVELPVLRAMTMPSAVFVGRLHCSRPPCYGWISESESESDDEESASRKKGAK